MSDDRVDLRIDVDTSRFEEGVEAAAKAELHALIFNAITTGLAEEGRFVALDERDRIATRVAEAVGQAPAPTDRQIRKYLDGNQQAFAQFMQREVRRDGAWFRRFMCEQDRQGRSGWRTV